MKKNYVKQGIKTVLDVIFVEKTEKNDSSTATRNCGGKNQTKYCLSLFNKFCKFVASASAYDNNYSSGIVEFTNWPSV